MASEMMEALIALAQEKHIDELYLLDRLEQSLAKSYADLLHLDWGAKVTIDRQTGKVWVYRLEPVDDSMDEEGNYQEWEEIDVTPADTSRTAAQHAKAEINSIVRMAAREAIYEEFSKRVGELITGTVLQVTNDFTILKIREGVEAELPHFDRRRFPDEMNERPNGEYYQHNQRVRAVIVGVRDPKAVQNGTASRGEHNRPAIIVSRTHPDLIRRLFELEVPEVYEGIVEVKAVSRVPGTRSKVAVASLEQHLDPVGACVGPKGTRVRTVVSELRGERIDVVLWDKDPAKYVANALSPAKVTRVRLSFPTTSSPWPSARRVRTLVSPPALPVGTSTSRMSRLPPTSWATCTPSWTTTSISPTRAAAPMSTSRATVAVTRLAPVRTSARCIRRPQASLTISTRSSSPVKGEIAWPRPRYAHVLPVGVPQTSQTWYDS